MQLSEATVLLVDDEPDLLEIFRRWFEPKARRVVTADNGRQALERVAEHHPDVIVSDVRMPVLDGVGMARQLKAAGTAAAAKIVFVSGFTDLSERDCFDLGIEAMLPKPLRRPTLMAAVQRCLLASGEKWRELPAGPCLQILSARFESLAMALHQGQIAFGSGGFCIGSALAATAGEPVGLDIVFDADRKALAGQGIVRWLDAGEKQVGIEIAYIDDDNRDWIAARAAQTRSRSFIPRTSRS